MRCQLESQDSGMSKDGVCGGLRSELRKRTIVEMSASVTGAVLFLFLWEIGEVLRFSVSDVGGEPCGVALVTTFHRSIGAICLPRGKDIA